jgi:hypothetical protein
MKSLGECRRIVFRAYSKICAMVEQDDGSNPERSKRLLIARERLNGMLDGLDSVGEWD